MRGGATLKVLRKEVVEDLEERRRFDREVRILATLDHPTIPALMDCRTTRQRRPFIAMELRRGERAADLGTLSLREVVELGRQLARALAAMHAVGIIHRDLNRTNVLIERFDDGRAPRASIIDFGQADLTDAFYAQADERYPTRPELRVVLGSGGLERADWTAPEARAGHGWSTASDVYSLGLLLHLLVTGKRPAEESPGVWRSPAERVPDCRGPLANAILRALQVDPKQRLDALGLVDDLEWAAAEIGGYVLPAELALEPEPEPTPPKPAVSSSPMRPVSARAGAPALASRSEPTRRSLAWFGVLSIFVAFAVWATARGQSRASSSDITVFAHAVRAAVAAEARPAEGNVDRPAAEALPTDKNVDPAVDKESGSPEDRMMDLPSVDAATSGEAEDMVAEAINVASTSPEPPPQRLPSMRRALRRAENDLRACSRLADGLLVVEFAADGSERFSAVTPVAETDAAVLACVRRATANIRFTSTRRPKFTEVYRP